MGTKSYISRIFGVLKYPFLALCVFLLLILFYLSKHGFPEWIVREVERKTQLQDLVFTIKGIKFDVFQGIILEDARCYLRGEAIDPIFKAEKLIINVSSLFRVHEDKASYYHYYHLTLYKGSMLMPISKIDNLKYPSTGDEMSLVISNISGELFFAPATGILLCSNVSFSGHGFNVKAHGSYILPVRRESAVFPSGTNASLQASTTNPEQLPSIKISHYIKTTLDILSKITNSASVLNADLYFHLDNITPKDNKVEVSLIAKNCIYHNIAIQLCMFKILLSDQNAIFNISVNNAKINDLILNNIVAEGSADKFTIRCEELVSTVDTNRPEDVIRGRFTVSLTNIPTFVGDFYGDFLPHKLTNIFQNEYYENIIKNLAFEMDSPSFKGRVLLSIHSNIIADIDGEIQADHTVFRGITNDFVNAKMHIVTSNEHIKTASIKRFLIVRENQIASGVFNIIPETGILNFSASSSLLPYNLLYMLFGSSFNFINNISTESSFFITGLGSLDYLHLENNNVDFTIEARKLVWCNLPFENCFIQANVNGNTILFPSIEAMLARGILNASAEINFADHTSNHTFFLEASLQDADCKNFLCNLLSSRQDIITRGRFNAMLQLSGKLDSLNSIVGGGFFTIKNSDILKIPLFTGFFHHLGGIIPGVKNLFQESNMEAQFTIVNGKILFRHITIDGDIFSLRASGNIDFDGKLDFNVQLTLLKKETLVGTLVQFALTPLSKALEFKLEGSIKEPMWRPVFIPNELMPKQE